MCFTLIDYRQYFYFFCGVVVVVVIEEQGEAGEDGEEKAEKEEGRLLPSLATIFLTLYLFLSFSPPPLSLRHSLYVHVTSYVLSVRKSTSCQQLLLRSRGIRRETERRNQFQFVIGLRASAPHL